MGDARDALPLTGGQGAHEGARGGEEHAAELPRAQALHDIARENDGDGDTDYVDILAIYKGYFIEFNMTPNPKAANQALTDEQIQMCIDFLTDVDFNIPAEKTDG